jgi:hypothetical protein
MSLTNDHTTGAKAYAGRLAGNAVGTNSTFRFVPRDLAAKCHKLIESYHAIHGFGCLPDMLWHSNARDIIECHRDLTQILKNASKSRRAKRANESLLLLATVVVSLEALARDFAGWGGRFPAARREAKALLEDFPRQHLWLMDMYLYPLFGFHREFASALAPPPADELAMARNSRN